MRMEDNNNVVGDSLDKLVAPALLECILFVRLLLFIMSLYVPLAYI